VWGPTTKVYTLAGDCFQIALSRSKTITVKELRSSTWAAETNQTAEAGIWDNSGCNDQKSLRALV
jgi:hypothetical protein